MAISNDIMAISNDDEYEINGVTFTEGDVVRFSRATLPQNQVRESGSPHSAPTNSKYLRTAAAAA
ncbi:hypothetical protein AB0K93_13310 [Streptomyces sp. NPDC052676]|uniref:hypothetical protein n=1 Tax=Streptomyces sp. NPDC052676 TaxID=3154953 RepID=UPI0034157BE4